MRRRRFSGALHLLAVVMAGAWATSPACLALRDLSPGGALLLPAGAAPLGPDSLPGSPSDGLPGRHGGRELLKKKKEPAETPPGSPEPSPSPDEETAAPAPSISPSPTAEARDAGTEAEVEGGKKQGDGSEEETVEPDEASSVAEEDLSEAEGTEVEVGSVAEVAEEEEIAESAVDDNSGAIDNAEVEDISSVVEDVEPEKDSESPVQGEDPVAEEGSPAATPVAADTPSQTPVEQAPEVTDAPQGTPQAARLPPPEARAPPGPEINSTSTPVSSTPTPTPPADTPNRPERTPAQSPESTIGVSPSTPTPLPTPAITLQATATPVTTPSASLQPVPATALPSQTPTQTDSWPAADKQWPSATPTNTSGVPATSQPTADVPSASVQAPGEAPAPTVMSPQQTVTVPQATQTVTLPQSEQTITDPQSEQPDSSIMPSGRTAQKELMEDIGSAVAGGIAFLAVLVLVLWKCCCRGPSSGARPGAAGNLEMAGLDLSSLHRLSDGQGFSDIPGSRLDIERQPLASNWNDTWESDDHSDWGELEENGGFASPPLSDNNDVPESSGRGKQPAASKLVAQALYTLGDSSREESPRSNTAASRRVASPSNWDEQWSPPASSQKGSVTPKQSVHAKSPDVEDWDAGWSPIKDPPADVPANRGNRAQKAAKRAATPPEWKDDGWDDDW